MIAQKNNPTSLKTSTNGKVAVLMRAALRYVFRDGLGSISLDELKQLLEQIYVQESKKRGLSIHEIARLSGRTPRNVSLLKSKYKKNSSENGTFYETQNYQAVCIVLEYCDEIPQSLTSIVKTIQIANLGFGPKSSRNFVNRMVERRLIRQTSNNKFITEKTEYPSKSCTPEKLQRRIDTVLHSADSALSACEPDDSPDIMRIDNYNGVFLSKKAIPKAIKEIHSEIPKRIETILSKYEKYNEGKEVFFSVVLGGAICRPQVLRLPLQERGNNAFSLWYNSELENKNQYQREALYP